MTTKAKKPAVVPALKEGSAMSESGGEMLAIPFAGCANYEELADLGRENFAAVLRANAALSEGLEAIGREMIGYARVSFENAAEAAAALLGAKTLDDVVQLNTEFAKVNLERLLAGSAKLSEMGVKVANEALAPLGSRVEATFQKLGKPLAA